MSSRTLVGGGLSIVDVDGSFARFVKNAPKEMRASLGDVVRKTTFALEQRLRATAPVGPEAPHIRDAVSSKVRGLSGQAGFINATEPAAPGSDSTMAEVALYNEYRPNAQPFMKPAAEAESSTFVTRMKTALTQVERDLSGGGGLR